MNVYDSRLITKILSQAGSPGNGYEETENLNKADIVIVNGCSVREHAEIRAIGRINDLQKLRKDNPNLKIGIAGCLAQRVKEFKSLRVQELKGIDFIAGPSDYKRLPEIIKGVKDSRSQVDEIYSDIFPEPENPACQSEAAGRDNRARITAFVPVMRGCENYCSYCIVPYVRGKIRSKNHIDVIKEITLLVKKGVKEVTLLGQSILEYRDTSRNDGTFALPELLSKIDSETDIKRIRFLTSHPKDLSEELLSVMKQRKSICEHIHLPLQSGSSRILKKMGRRYTREYYLDWIGKIRKIIPGSSITTDIIVGFPGETNEDFQETIEVVKEVKFDFAYMFKYSERVGTKAYSIFPKVSEQEKSERLKELINLQNQFVKQKNKGLIGKTVEVLVEGKAKRNELLYGRTRTNKAVVFPVCRQARSGNVSPGDFVDVKINMLSGWTPVGILARSYTLNLNSIISPSWTI